MIHSNGKDGAAGPTLQTGSSSPACCFSSCGRLSRLGYCLASRLLGTVIALSGRHEPLPNPGREPELETAGLRQDSGLMCEGNSYAIPSLPVMFSVLQKLTHPRLFVTRSWLPCARLLAALSHLSEFYPNSWSLELHQRRLKSYVSESCLFNPVSRIQAIIGSHMRGQPAAHAYAQRVLHGDNSRKSDLRSLHELQPEDGAGRNRTRHRGQLLHCTVLSIDCASVLPWCIVAAECRCLWMLHLSRKDIIAVCA